MLHYLTIHPATVGLVIHTIILIALSIRVIMKRPPAGVALAWLLLIAVAPFAGPVIYLLIGERRISINRAKGMEHLQVTFRRAAHIAIKENRTGVDWENVPGLAKELQQVGLSLVGFPTVSGSRHQLFFDTEETLRAIAKDIDAAERCVLMEFYIWHPGGIADEVLEAVIRASQRGVECRLLIDALGARPWWKTDQPRRLKAAGVKLQAALPVGILRTFVGRTDVRLHRKIVVVDGRVAWTGSMNLVDPRYFKQDAGVGEWVDAMVRLEGSVIIPLTATLVGDWKLETGEAIEPIIQLADIRNTPAKGDSVIQVIPSGPGESGDAQLQMILALIYEARQEVVLTTPYLVPDESLLRAIRGAAIRGVDVQLIVPERVDSRMTRYASRSFYDELLEAGVKIHLYNKGLLHTKSISIDKTMAMFGTVNLDMRSLWLNYEVALYVYDADFGEQLRDLQQTYINDSIELVSQTWNRRPFRERLLENTFRLASPLL